MTFTIDRRRLLQASLLTTLPALLAASRTSGAFAADEARPAEPATGSIHDFDFFLGRWQVRHRRLKKRLANNDDWEEFAGTSHCLSLLDGVVNVNESRVDRPGGSYRGMGIRAFDASTRTWADWYLDGRNPTRIDVPGVGRFVGGVGIFVSDETFEGRPIKVRGLWTHITPTSWQWEQAFSADEGRTWETNWVMYHTRISE